jgi:ribosomal protein S12 methylthiotransferase
MLGQLVEAGCHITADQADADAVVVNTCGFLSAARDEAIDAIREVAKLKVAGIVKRIVVAGCLVQRDGRALLDQVPEIDALVGVNNREDLARAVLDTQPREGRKKRGRRPADLYLGDYYPRADDDTARLRITPRHYAYLRIGEGCDQKCTFCTIPSIRGSMHCKPPDAILAEARELVSDGAVEINLIGQDTTSYGSDIGYQPGLAGLLRQIDRVNGVTWLRLMYAYPSVMTDEMIDAVAECDRVVKYIDLPLQHVNDRVLRAMHRRVDRSATERLLTRLRDRIPGVAIRTTMIAGFPGETEAEFAEQLEFVRGFKFDALGVFAYSHEPETPAGRMAGQLPDQVKRQRVDELMTAQQQVAFELADARVGQELELLVEGPPTDGLIPARHAGQAPEVDSTTWLRAGGSVAPGEFVTARCTGRRDYDLLATATDAALPVLATP